MIDEYLKLKNKIYNMIILNKTLKETFIFNQEGKLFTRSIPNNHSRKFREYIFGGLVKIFSERYSSTLSFDFQGIFKSTKFIAFSSLTEHSGENFKEFCSKIINGKESDFIWVHEMCAYNIKSQLKEIYSIQINNTKVDSFLAKQICSLFPCLETIEFNHCIIESNCKFKTDKNIKLHFNDCTIESSMCLIDIKNDFSFCRCDFEYINSSTLYSDCYSKHISMFECNIDLFTLFFKTNFPDLEYLSVEFIPEYDEKGNNYQRNLGNSFEFLPDSCPHLHNLIIEASLDNIDFLSRMPFLENITIFSSSGVMDYPLLKLNDYKSVKKLEEKNKTRIKIKQIINNNQDEENKEYYVTESEIERVLEMNNFYKTIYMTPDEANAIIKYGNILSHMLKPDFIKLDGYYENYYGHLIFRHLEKDPYYIADRLKELKYLHNFLFYEAPNDKIVLAKNFLFYIDGRPIIFSNERKIKPIKTEQDALEFQSKNPSSSTKCEDLTEEYIKNLKEFVNMSDENELEDVTVSDFISAMRSFDLDVPLNLIYKDLLKRLENGHEIIYKLLKEDEAWKYTMHLRKVYEKCLNALIDMINRNFSKFTFDELIYILKYLPEENLIDRPREFSFNPYFDIDSLNIDEMSLAIKIDSKLNGKYKKLLNSINSIKKLERNFVKKEPILTREDQAKIKTLSLKNELKK